MLIFKSFFPFRKDGAVFPTLIFRAYKITENLNNSPKTN